MGFEFQNDTNNDNEKLPSDKWETVEQALKYIDKVGVSNDENEGKKTERINNNYYQIMQFIGLTVNSFSDLLDLDTVEKDSEAYNGIKVEITKLKDLKTRLGKDHPSASSDFEKVYKR